MIYARPGRRRPMSEINVVPYIDVMLVLLVIFMATAPLLMQGVEVALPRTDNAPLPDAQREDPLMVSVRADGSIWVNFGVGGEGERDGRDARISIGALEEQAGKVLRSRPEVPVYVRADASIAYGRVMEVMAVLQRAGAAEVGLVTEPPELDR